VFGALVPRVVKRVLRIDEKGIARSRSRVDEGLAKVEDLLSDGRRHLVGDGFTAADLTFGALDAPLVGPPEQPVTGSVQALGSLGALSDESRSRPAGVFALRLYAEERKRISRD
jgi:glutathione S-transferase